MAAGIHLFPFRTEKLSPPAPMVLRGRLRGRVGRRPLFMLGASRLAARFGLRLSARSSLRLPLVSTLRLTPSLVSTALRALSGVRVERSRCVPRGRLRPSLGALDVNCGDANLLFRTVPVRCPVGGCAYR